MWGGARGRGRPRERWLNEVVETTGLNIWVGRHKKQLEIVVDGED